jgi:hypothetical protein
MGMTIARTLPVTWWGIGAIVMVRTPTTCKIPGREKFQRRSRKFTVSAYSFGSFCELSNGGQFSVFSFQQGEDARVPRAACCLRESATGGQAAKGARKL